MGKGVAGADSLRGEKRACAGTLRTSTLEDMGSNQADWASLRSNRKPDISEQGSEAMAVGFRTMDLLAINGMA